MALTAVVMCADCDSRQADVEVERPLTATKTMTVALCKKCAAKPYVPDTGIAGTLASRGLYLMKGVNNSPEGPLMPGQGRVR